MHHHSHTHLHQHTNIGIDTMSATILSNHGYLHPFAPENMIMKTWCMDIKKHDKMDPLHLPEILDLSFPSLLENFKLPS